jgi:hypothetical protein
MWAVKVPKYYLIGVDMIEKVKTADEKVLPFQKLVHHTDFPTRRHILHIHATIYYYYYYVCSRKLVCTDLLCL